MKPIPYNFSFYHAGTTQRYDMDLVLTDWRCTSASSQNASYYTESEIRQHIADGDWWVIPQEPEMKYPLTFTHNNISYFAKKNYDGRVTLGSKDLMWEDEDFPESALKDCIKDGTYIVTSVGEQPYELSEAEGSYNPLEASTSPSKDVGTYTVKINSEGVEEALKAVKELSDVVDSVNAGLERMNELLGQIGGGTVSYSVESTNRPDFNFEEF